MCRQSGRLLSTFVTGQEAEVLIIRLERGGELKTQLLTSVQYQRFLYSSLATGGRIRVQGWGDMTEGVHPADFSQPEPVLALLKYQPSIRRPLILPMNHSLSGRVAGAETLTETVPLGRARETGPLLAAQ
jgi:hypothetical protein